MKLYYFNPDTDMLELEERVGKPLDAFTEQDLNISTTAVCFDLTNEHSLRMFVDAFNDGELEGGQIVVINS